MQGTFAKSGKIQDNEESQDDAESQEETGSDEEAGGQQDTAMPGGSDIRSQDEIERQDGTESQDEIESQDDTGSQDDTESGAFTEAAKQLTAAKPTKAGPFKAGPTKPGPTQARLEAVSNVPWHELLIPGNDRDTQKRMRVHREKEAKYNALTPDQRERKPAVLPYPQSPDKVFPGTPCYRVAVNGQYRFVFVIDTGDPLNMSLYPPGQQWDGTARAQSKAYWIVPHFIYREEEMVTLHRSIWNAVSIRNSVHDHHQLTLANPRAPLGPPSKFDFNSIKQVRARHMPNGYPISTTLAQGAPGLCRHDSYYVPGTDNGEVNAPVIRDPVFMKPFNTKANPVIPFQTQLPLITFDDYRIRPYPYNQPSPPFPQQPDPPVRYPFVPPQPPAPAGARRRRRPALPPPLPALPSELVAEPPTYSGRDGVDWILQSNDNYEIGSNTLRDCCMQAEELDYAFALRIQGLRGSSLPAVWNCTDPAYDVTDRSAVLAQFVRMYMEKFYNRVDVGSSTSDVQEVIHEAMTMHEEFCKGWVEKHHRTLSAEVESAAEALVGVFYNSLKPAFPNGVSITRTHVARYLRRHAELSGEFSYCLYHFMTSLEQLRGNRNASYRAMQGEKQSGITAMKRMGAMLEEKLAMMKQELQSVDLPELIFGPRFIDWHYISGQLPAHHKEFDGYLNSFSMFRTRTGGRGNQFPPWQQMRFR